MIEGRPRQSLVLYDPPQEVPAGGVDPFQKSFGGKFLTDISRPLFEILNGCFHNVVPCCVEIQTNETFLLC